MRVGVGVAAVVIALAVAGELLLPGMAADRLRDDLATSGDVRRVEVAAFPALRLLFDSADRVEIEMGEARAGAGRLADLLARTAAAGQLDATVQTLRVGPLLARDLRLTKRGDRLVGEAGVTDADLAAALPAAIALRPVDSRDGQLVLEASAPVLGARLAVRARLSVRDGALVIAPDGVAGAFASLTVFSDPRLDVTGVGARPRGDGFTVTAQARLT